MGILISLTLFMFNSPLRRIYQTSKHLIQVPTTAIRTTMSSSSERQTGLIGKSGIELLTFAGVDLAKFPNVERWWKSIVARPAVKAGLAVPSESRIVNEAYLRRLKEEDGFKEA